MSSTLLFYGHFTTSGSGATGLTVTTDITRITRSSSAVATHTTAGAATEITAPNANGVYFFKITDADLTLYDYIAVFKTTGACDQNRVPALYTPAPANIKQVNDLGVDGVGTTGDPWGPV